MIYMHITVTLACFVLAVCAQSHKPVPAVFNKKLLNKMAPQNCCEQGENRSTVRHLVTETNVTQNAMPHVTVRLVKAT